jgi:glycosyltransferase involved in cell wall biosynthesis
MRTVLQICVEGNTGSTGRIAESIGELALKNDWKSYIAYGRFPRPSKSELIKIGSEWNIFLHGLQTRFVDRHCLGSKSATKRLVEQIIQINPDIIHLHHIHGYYINMQILFEFLKSTSIPIVWTFHDCWSITGHCSNFDFIGCDKWKTECFSCPQKKEYPASYFFDRSKKNYQLKKKLFTSVENLTIVSVSNWLDSIVANSFLKNNERIVIYNGIDTNLFKPETNREIIREKYNIGKNYFILGVASTWGQRKGFDDFLQLSNYLQKDEKIILIGLNKTQIKHLPENIIGLSRTENQTELKNLYSTADAFLNLSVEETFGLTTAEALACGTPAIVYDSTACPEIIDRNTGIVVQKRNINDLVNAIRTVRRNGKTFYGNACRNRAITQFNQKDRLNEYFNLYERLYIKNKL